MSDMADWATRLQHVLDERERTWAWLSRHAGINYTQLYYLRYNRPTHDGSHYAMRPDMQTRICQALAEPGQGQRTLQRRIFGNDNDDQ